MSERLPSVEQVTDSSSEEGGGPAPPKVSVNLKRKRTPLDSDENVRGVLGKKCGCSKSRCYDQFRDGQPYAELLRFRSDWCKFHKLDQDRVVSCHSAN